jgi:hypothetical protein
MLDVLGGHLLSFRIQHLPIVSWRTILAWLCLLLLSVLPCRQIHFWIRKLGLPLLVPGWILLSVGCNELSELLPGLLRPIVWLRFLPCLRCWPLHSRLRILELPQLPVGTVSTLHRLFRLLMLQCWLLSIDFRLLVVHRHMPCRTLRTKLRQWLH